MQHYQNLFSPIRVRGLYIKNRIESAPMSPSGDVPFYTREAWEMYDSFARGGAGIVTLGEAGVHSLTDCAHPTMPHLDNEVLLPSLIQTVDTVHKWGAAASIELVHSGSRAKGEFLAPGGYVIGPSPMEANLYGDRVLEMDQAMMEEIADAYAQAAFMAEFAGVDIVNIHGGHGWLIGQFLSDLNNKRTDEYGGSIENKACFPLMVIEKIRQRCPKLIIEFRLSAVEETPGGMEIEEAVELAKLLDGKVDIIHISAATFHDTKSSVRMFPSVFYPRGVNIDNAARIKAVVKKSLVSVVGALSDPQQMDDLLSQAKADFVVVGRQFIADPSWPKKAKEGRKDEIRTCTRCQVCISAGFIPHVPFSSGVLRCTANPSFGREYENTRREIKVEKPKKILIAGGGPSGLKAALTASARGHQVILCEKEDHFNANLDYAKHSYFKDDLVSFAKSLVVSAQRSDGIDLRLNTEVDEELIKELSPDVLILACGGEPLLPTIPGIDLPHVYTVTDTIRKKISMGKRVLVIGGGLAGCEEGLALAHKGHDVTIVEMLDGLAKEAPYIHWLHLLPKLDEAFKAYTSTRVLAIEEEGVRVLMENGKEEVLETDSVLIATGMKGTSEKYDNWHKLVEEVRVIGDCQRSATVQEAMRSGYSAGLTI